MKVRGRTISTKGYVLIFMPQHPRAGKSGYVREHLLVAEKALGRPIPPNVQVHHWDENRGNNDPSNLVICEDDAYHKLLHKRACSYKASGRVDWLICNFCGVCDDPSAMYVSKNGWAHFHTKCRNERRPQRGKQEQRVHP